MASLADYDLCTFQAKLVAAGHNPVHAPAVLREFYREAGGAGIGTATIGKELREYLHQEFSSSDARILHRTVAGDGTTKLLLGLHTGGSVEAVLMPAFRPDIAAGCVSSQIGCAMGCDFCASTRNGLERNLTSGEIVQQFLHLKREAGLLNRRLRTLVFMGMGEPLLNFDAVVEAIRRIGEPTLGQLGWRQITVSTVGIVPGIDRLAGLNLNVHLAVSLHAPDDATRAKLVPMNRRYAVADILAAARRFYSITGRIPTIEYCMLAGVNDTDEQAALLTSHLRGFRAHVNLIPYNNIGTGISGVVYQRPNPRRMAAFLDILRSAGTVAHCRDTRGDDVNAACGQLRQHSLPLNITNNGAISCAV